MADRARPGPASASPSWHPPGLELCAYDHEREGRAVHEAIEESFADHWEHHPVSWEEWRERAFCDRFDPGLWLVARDGAEIAGALVGQWKRHGDWG